MMKISTITLNNGFKIPAIGYGPGILRPYEPFHFKNKYFIFLQKGLQKFSKKFHYEEKYVDAIANAFKIGLSLLDFSSTYGNERLIGKAVKRSGVNRKQLFLTTRVSNKQQLDGNIRDEFLRTLDKYETDYIDLYMLHWPVTGVYLGTWKQMEQLYSEGYCRAIGVSNCHQHHLKAILEISEVFPAINQVEVHPLFTQKPLISYCKSKNIVVQAYTPLARFDERLVRRPTLKKIARNYNKTIAQITLRWHVQNGLIPIFKTLNRNRQFENSSIFDFELTNEEMNAIDSFNINSRLRYDPDNSDFSIL